jgi:hypothetical protein
MNVTHSGGRNIDLAQAMVFRRSRFTGASGHRRRGANHSRRQCNHWNCPNRKRCVPLHRAVYITLLLPCGEKKRPNPPREVWEIIADRLKPDDPSSILDVMYANAPYTVIQRAMHIHPTVTELIPTMLGELKPLK